MPRWQFLARNSQTNGIESAHREIDCSVFWLSCRLILPTLWRWHLHRDFASVPSISSVKEGSQHRNYTELNSCLISTVNSRIAVGLRVFRSLRLPAIALCRHVDTAGRCCVVIMVASYPRRRRAPRLDESIVQGVSGAESAVHHCVVICDVICVGGVQAWQSGGSQSEVWRNVDRILAYSLTYLLIYLQLLTTNHAVLRCGLWLPLL